MAIDYARQIGGKFLDYGGAVKNVKHPTGAVVGGGVTDDTAALQAIITAATTGDHILIPPGTYGITDELLITGKTSVTLGCSSADGATFLWIGASAPSKAMLRITNSYRCRVEGILFDGGATALNRPGYGGWITSAGTSVTQENAFVRCKFKRVTTTGVKVGNANNLDTNVDMNLVQFCSFDTTGEHCVRIDGSNINQTRIDKCTMAYATVAGVYVGTSTRGVEIVQPFFVENGTAHVYIDRTITSPVEISGVISELFTHPLLYAQPTGGGQASAGSVTISDFNLTCNFASAAIKLIDYQQSGVLTLRNGRIAGIADGTPTYIDVQPQPTAQPGSCLLITEGVQLHSGAAFNVRTTGINPVRWIDLGTTYAVDTTSPGDTPILSLTGVPLELNGVTPAGATGVTVGHSGRVGRQTYTFALSTAAFFAAATSQTVSLCSLPARTRIVSVIADTTTAYAGLAGTIQLTVQGTGGVHVLAHDVKTAAVTKGLADADLGTTINRANAVQGGFIPSWSGSPGVEVVLASGSGNLGDGTTTNLTAGATTIYLTVETLP